MNLVSVLGLTGQSTRVFQTAILHKQHANLYPFRQILDAFRTKLRIFGVIIPLRSSLPCQTQFNNTSDHLRLEILFDLLAREGNHNGCIFPETTKLLRETHHYLPCLSTKQATASELASAALTVMNVISDNFTSAL